ncbi:unnamed protein product [Phytophthora lilii]|uniref:Unnamed protein product n=1 Tax=Phytophthora lilii TaxID=2077276 RepID=A0A9W6X7W7_9STRA|nr:unnamed protein product [Phytophthora lilii]
MLVPVIDISPFVNEIASSRAARDQVVDQVADACRNVGFLVITNHGIASETIEHAFEAAKDYFDQPSEVKKQVSMSPEYPYGYESAEILSNSRKKNYGKALPDLKETFQVCVGPDGHEPSDQEPGTEQIRASAHTDYGSLTILAVDAAPGGLQVRDLQGEWHNVKAPANSFVVNLGDLMQHWTNDQWRSTMHRVINPPSGCQSNRRQSIAFFHNINADTIVECIATCQSPENPAKYPPVLAGEYLMKKHSAAMGN